MRQTSKEREAYLDEMVKLANDVAKNYTWEKWGRLWDMSSDWNSAHSEEEEIAMFEHENEDGEVDGFYIEDDYWLVEE